MKLSTLVSVRRLVLLHADDKLPAALAYKFMKLLKASEKEEQFYSEKMQKIINEFAARDDDGNIKMEKDNIIIAPDKVKACRAEMDDLSSTEVDKPPVQFFIDELASLSVSTSEILALSDFIAED